MPSKPLVLKNTLLIILFFFAVNIFLYKKAFYSHCNISTLKGSEGKTKLNFGFIWALRPVQREDTRHLTYCLAISCDLLIHTVHKKEEGDIIKNYWMIYWRVEFPNK